MLIHFQLALGQIGLNKDSLIYQYTQEGLNSLRNGEPIYSDTLFTKAIELDSSYYGLYYLRGFSRLMKYNFMKVEWDTLELKTNHQMKPQKKLGSRDTLQFNLAINDFIKCIQLKYKSNKLFPDSSLSTMFPDNYQLPTDYRKHDGGEISIALECKYIYEGVLVYITTNSQNRKAACKVWQLAFDEGLIYTKLLINKYCE